MIPEILFELCSGQKCGRRTDRRQVQSNIINVSKNWNFEKKKNLFPMTESQFEKAQIKKNKGTGETFKKHNNHEVS